MAGDRTLLLTAHLWMVIFLGGKLTLNTHTLLHRSGAMAAAAALAAVGLVAGFSNPAHAEPSTGTYVCTAPGLGSVNIPVAVTPPALPANIPAGLPVPAQIVKVTVTFTMPKKAVTALTALGVTGGKAPDFAILLGETPIPADNLVVTDLVTNPDGTGTWTASGKNGAFTTPAPGTYDVTMPAAFTLTAMSGDAELSSLACTTETPTLMSAMTVIKQSASLSANGSRIKKGKRATVPVSVSNMVGGASGTVVAKLDGRALATKTLTNGKTAFRTPVLKKVGKHKLSLRYLGDTNTAGATKTVVIVVRA